MVGGSAAAARFGGDAWLPLIALAITGGSAASLVFGLAESARRHSDLATQHKRLEAEILAAGENSPTEAELPRWSARCAEIEAGEPDALFVLTQLCEERLNLANGTPEKSPTVGPVKRLLAQYFSFSPRPNPSNKQPA